MRLESSPKRLRIYRTSMSSEASRTVLGAKRLIKKHEFVRVIIQCLYSLGFGESASCLELESGISDKSLEFELLKSQILAGNWDGCIHTLRTFKDLVDDTRASALFLIFKQCILEYLSRGDYSLALTILRKEVSALEVGRDKVHNLAHSVLSLEELGKNDDSVILGLRKKLLRELEHLLPPPFIVPEKRLEHLVETIVLAQIDSCVYHNSPDLVSLCVDHSCGRDQIPTKTIQVCLPVIMLQLW